ncbi:MAG: hypothetical protein JOZ90_14910 [Alphaproteobacteria bacterium]|nr:hypothetical protein [Alphaproteobacteria bacterium]MBV9371427.1 hypothetical protein [Alphaproteobacteria bacterium]MBV9902364.1 hypothetical protein [Alphaproteobacteria bacterium]
MGGKRLSWAGAGLLLLGAKAPPPPPVAYSLGVADGHGLAVELRFAGDRDGETQIHLPDAWAGSKALWRGISDLTVEGGRVSGEGADRTIRHRPGAPLVVRYRVASGGGGVEPSGEKARPTVDPDWFFFHGEGVFATVEGRALGPATFRWGKIPAGWTAVSDLDHLRGRTTTADQVVESAAVGGKRLAVAIRIIGRAPLRVAIVGDWGFPADALAERMARIMAAEHGFWGEPAGPFVVTLAPLAAEPGVISSTGTGRGDGFSLLSTPGFALDQATRLLAHEYMHHWVPGLIGGQPEEGQAREFWFSEGFDDYLTSRTLLGSGLWSFEDYLADLNRVLLRYQTSPARAATGADIAAKFWEDQNVEQIPYDRGHLLALAVDARIRAASGGRKSLDDVLRAQRQAARTAKLTGAPLFLATLKRVTGLDMTGEILRTADGAAGPALPADALEPCARIEPRPRRAFSRGFDLAATQAAHMSLRGVDPSGPAFAAGLRDNMRILKREAGEIGDSTKEIAYRVEDAGVERVIRYRPEGKETIVVQQAVPASSFDEGLCRRLLGGAR